MTLFDTTAFDLNAYLARIGHRSASRADMETLRESRCSTRARFRLKT